MSTQGVRRLDERQRTIESSVAKNSIFFTFVVVFINAAIAQHHEWASPLVQAFTVFLIACLWITVQCLWRGAYISVSTRRKASTKFGAEILSLCGWWYLASLNVSQASDIWHVGRAGRGFPMVFAAAIFTVMTLSEIIRFARDRRLENAPDED